jgi:hypothetical protein
MTKVILGGGSRPLERVSEASYEIGNGFNGLQPKNASSEDCEVISIA